MGDQIEKLCMNKSKQDTRKEPNKYGTGNITLLKGKGEGGNMTHCYLSSEFDAASLL
jgi:hypothetical protein